MTARAHPLIIIIAYRSDGHLEECLHVLDRGPAVVVVDNDDAPTTRAICTRAGVDYLASHDNVGFARAVNRGLEHRWDGTSDVLLLNPDARMTWSAVLDLQKGLRSETAAYAAVGPRLVGDSDAPQNATWPMPSPAQVWLDVIGAGSRWRGRRFVTGAALMLNGAALAELGPLDERYFLYAEEADWQMRAQRAGWRVGVVDTVTVRHVGGASSSDSQVRDALFHRSGQAFARKWYGPVRRQLMWTGSVVAALRRAATARASERTRHLRAARLLLAERSVPRSAADSAAVSTR